MRAIKIKKVTSYHQLMAGELKRQIKGADVNLLRELVCQDASYLIISGVTMIMEDLII